MRNKRVAVYLEAADLATIDRIAREFGDLSRSAVAGVLIRQALAAIARGGTLALGSRLVQPYDPTTDPADGGHTADAYAGPEFGYIPPPNLLNAPVFRTEAQADMGELFECVNAQCPRFPHFYRKGNHDQ